ncbi:acyl carrier protein [Nocardia thailandica]|uniref:acyl carrier protein n=1 Tax=Nocardia thailandica TaxID=257275 RepID=UPI0002E63F61|nr:phosphopantetheine-binding protein [Nocardia thailandica]
MTTPITDDTICRIIGAAVPRAQGVITPSSSLRGELGIDSVGLMSIVLMLEEKVGIDAFDHVEEFIGAEQVSDIIAIVRQASAA